MLSTIPPGSFIWPEGRSASSAVRALASYPPTVHAIISFVETRY